MRLFVAEKPSLAKTIAESLGIQRRTQGSYQCDNENVVTWCFGHLLEMAQPETYNPAWANRYDKRILPIVPEQITLVPRDDSGVRTQLQIIDGLLRQAQEVVNAGDPDREGQLLVDEVLEYLHYTGPTKRIFLASLDPKSIEKALAKLEDNKKYRHWKDAAQTRRTIDWLGGINMSRAMTIYGNSIGLTGILSLGRVQTPTLRLVVERDHQIANFVPIDYAQLVAQIQHKNGLFKATFTPNDECPGLDPEGRLIDFAVAEKIQKESANLPGSIIQCERKKAREYPKLPYSLASLQSDMNAKHALGAERVLQIAQKLYETKLTTYPRTDCEYLPEEQFEQAQELLSSLSQIQALADAAKGADSSLHSKAWNTKKVTAHHAIIPTGILPHGLLEEEMQVYLAIATRYIIQFWPPLEYEATKITVRLENQTQWEANGKCILEAGWTKIVRPEKDKDKDENAQLPKVRKNDSITSQDIDLIKKRTTPPAHFTEGTLINAMKNIHRFVDDADAKAKLRETSGLGTEATRATILEILKDRGYITLKGKSLLATSKGENVIALCPNSMKDIVTTASLEDKLSDVQAGKVPSKDTIATYVTYLPSMIHELFSQGFIQLPNITYIHCPACDGVIERIYSKKNDTYLWLCHTCHTTFKDAEGKIGEKILRGEISSTYTCPICQKPLVKHERKNSSEFFWMCINYPQCQWVASDDNGKPGSPERELSKDHLCPSCGKPLVRIKKKDGSGFFWSCSGYPKCRWAAPDDNGKPGIPDREISTKYTCPSCGKPLARIKKKDGSGFFWSCSEYPACNWAAPDDNGKPGIPDRELSTKYSCPSCGKPLARIKKKDGSGFFWSCSGYPACNWAAPDDAGKPGIPDREISTKYTCPSCGKPLARIKKKDGSGFFWSCSGYPACRWAAPDDNGKPGTPDREISTKYTCPSCGKPLARIKKKDGSGFFWSCTGYPACRWAAPDDNGKPGTPDREISTKYTCPSCGKPLVHIRRKDGSGFFWSCSGYPTCKWSSNAQVPAQKDDPKI